MGLPSKAVVMSRQTGRHVKLPPPRNLKAKPKPRLLPDHIDIKKEYQLILSKESKLNRTQRDAIVDYYNSPIYKRFWYNLVALKYIIQNYKLQRQK